MGSKVFVIGFHKTGTTSLERALIRLGYNVSTVDKNLLSFDNTEDLKKYLIEVMGQWDAVQDMPWPLFYKDLYNVFPNGKYILTLRSNEDWINSVVKYWGSIRVPFHRKIYNVPCAEGYENQYKEIYKKHNEEVIEFFKGKSNFLIMKIGENFDYSTLCNFLGIDNVPNDNFPHARNNTRRNLPKYKWYRTVRSIYWNYKKGY